MTYGRLVNISYKNQDLLEIFINLTLYIYLRLITWNSYLTLRSLLLKLIFICLMIMLIRISMLLCKMCFKFITFSQIMPSRTTKCLALKLISWVISFLACYHLRFWVSQNSLCHFLFIAWRSKYQPPPLQCSFPFYYQYNFWWCQYSL